MGFRSSVNPTKVRKERERERVQVQFGSLCVKEKPEEDFFARRSEM